MQFDNTVMYLPHTIVSCNLAVDLLTTTTTTTPLQFYTQYSICTNAQWAGSVSNLTVF